MRMRRVAVLIESSRAYDAVQLASYLKIRREHQAAGFALVTLISRKG
jgi:hypothetical protein